MSRHVQVTRTIPAPVDEVFAMISDSDRLATLPGVRVRILEPGHGSRDGVGLKRRVDFGAGLFLVEEVVGLDAPQRFDYRIRAARPGFRHEYGRISFTPSGEGTTVVWSSTFGVPAGPLTPLVEAGAALGASAAFGLVLARIERALAQQVQR